MYEYEYEYDRESSISIAISTWVEIVRQLTVGRGNHSILNF
jgi:hypothetical protein